VPQNIPAHVPPDRVYDYDISHDPLLEPDLHLGLMELGRRAPEIFFTPRYGGHWVAQSHAAVYDIARDPGLFSSDQGFRKLIPIRADPPEHERYRMALLQAFSPRAITAMTGAIRQLTTDLIDKVAASGACEFVGDISEPLPVTLFMTMLGLPLEMMAPVRKLVVETLIEGDPVVKERLYDAQMEMLDPVIRARIEKPADDMLSRIITADIGGRRPTFDEVRNFVLLLSLAGLDTVTNAMSFSIWRLARDPALQAQLRDDPALIPAAMEEFFRRYAPSSIGRRVTRDTVFRGVPLRAGELFICLIPAANLDGAAYADPEAMILNRDEPAITFGAGIHRCLGSHLARLELRIFLTEWLRRIPEFRLAPASTPRAHAGWVYTVDELRLEWDGARAVA
jgi:cytochrome P450